MAGHLPTWVSKCCASCRHWHRRWIMTAAACVVLLGPSLAVGGTPPIEIWLSDQSGRFGDYSFSALGGRRSHPTPKGRFTVLYKARRAYSRKYRASMPLALFFTSQCAIHVGSLGVKSHGCIHVSRDTAEYLFEYAESGSTRVIIHR